MHWRQPQTTDPALEQALEGGIDAHATGQVRLGEVLVGDGLVTAQAVVDALVEQRSRHDMSLGALLVERGLVTPEQIQLCLAKKLGIPRVDPTRFGIDPAVLALVPEALARKYLVLPIYRRDRRLVVVMDDPLASAPLEQLRFSTGLQIEAAMAPREALQAAIDKYYSLAQPLEEDLEELIHAGEEEAGDEAAAEDDDLMIADNTVVRLVNRIFLDAYRRGASDVHIEPQSGHAPVHVRMRVDGALQHYCDIAPAMRRAVTARIKIMAGLDISERRRPQDGKIDFRKQLGRSMELRVATVPTAGGDEHVVVRLLGTGPLIPISDIGLEEDLHRSLIAAVDKPLGLFLVCGPTGSGKTTTLHSVLRHLNTEDRKIWTVEDPVEITQPGLCQVQVDHRVGVGFASAMRAFLRADPDVIMVGELRDRETSAIAIEASLTGHLVLATLHTNSAPESLLRLLDLGMDPFNFSDALLGVLAQRLARRLCPSCRVAYRAEAEDVDALLREYAADFPEALSDEAGLSGVRQAWQQRFASDGHYSLYRAEGCDRCAGSGYRGRVGIHELLIATPAIRRLILSHASMAELSAAAMTAGMRTLKQDGILKVLDGKTDIQQIRKVCSR